MVGHWIVQHPGGRTVRLGRAGVEIHIRPQLPEKGRGRGRFPAAGQAAALLYRQPGYQSLTSCRMTESGLRKM